MSRALRAAAIAALFLTGCLLLVPATRADAPVPDASPSTADGGAGGPFPLLELSRMARAAPEEKLAPDLRPLARTKDGHRLVIVKSTAPLETGSLGHVLHRFRWPAGEHLALVQVRTPNLLRLAALPTVASIAAGDVPARARVHPARAAIEGGLDRPPGAFAPAGKRPTMVGASMVGAAADGQPASPVATARGSRMEPAVPDGWFDVGDGHGGRDAWALGYRGTGVRLAILDSGIDFAHPDLAGTWAILGESDPGAGWPYVYDPVAAYAYLLDTTAGITSTLATKGVGSLVHMYQAAEVVAGEGGLTACLRPKAPWDEPPAPQTDCGYRVPPSRSGIVRYGHHPSLDLSGWVAIGGGEAEAGDPVEEGHWEYAGVLLVDVHEAGVYDTVYVDLDLDHDFTDEVPPTREQPLVARDLHEPPDGVADISGGLLYFIADGQRSIPGAYLWGLEDRVPESGSYVGLFYDDGAHGTLVASNVASQGRLDNPDLRPKLRDLSEQTPFVPNPAMAPEARLVGIGDVYYGPQILFESAWRFATLGADPDSEADGIQIAVNSYGWSEVDDDGWDQDSRLIDYYVRTFSPTTAFLFATGNGGPGYGTISPPSPATGIAVAASTQMGATGSESITDTRQITFGDLAPFSNRGPGTDGRHGPDVAANGAIGWGARPINNMLDSRTVITETGRGGRSAFTSWGGTSRAAPVAAAALALVDEAFRARQGRWPEWHEARALLMAGARFAGYDAFAMGSGVVDAGDAVRLAAGQGGVYASPSAWPAGDYHGRAYPGFVKLVAPGSTSRTTITLSNPSAADVTARLAARTSRRIGSYATALTTTQAVESNYQSAVPDYLVPIDRSQVPPGTELLGVRAVLPIEEVDPRDELELANYFELAVLQHTDVNGDGMLWVDADGNGVVTHEPEAAEEGVCLECGESPGVDWAKTEIQRWEYGRFAVGSAGTNSWAVAVHHPLERWRDGLYIAVWHQGGCEEPPAGGSGEPYCWGRPKEVPHANFGLRVDFYAYRDWPWLTIPESTLIVPAGGTASFEAALAIPAGAASGAYVGAIFADYDRPVGDAPVESGGGYELPDRRLTVPVTANVADRYDWHGTVSLAGAPARDAAAPYDNGALRGGLGWWWRPETGDWRFFFVDAPTPQSGTLWLTRTTWAESEPGHTDIDTQLWAAAPDRFSGPEPDPDGTTDPDWYGPAGLRRVAASRSTWQGGGVWTYRTSSRVNEDWLAAPAGEGLLEVMLHNVRFGGRDHEVPFETTVSAARVQPAAVTLAAADCAQVRLTSEIALPGLRALGVGLSQPIHIADQPIEAEGYYRHRIEVRERAARFDVTLRGEPGVDLDLRVLFDANQDGYFSYAEEIAGSYSMAADEDISLVGLWPFGDYQIVVAAYDVPTGATRFDLTIDVVEGDDLRVVRTAGDPAAGGYPVTVCTDGADGASVPLEGALVLGNRAAPTLLSIPVHWQPERAQHTLFLPALRHGR